MEQVTFKNNGKLKLLIIVGTRPEIIRLAAVINKARIYFDTVLAHTGQNYDYNLNGVFFKDLGLADPDVYMNAVGADLGETMGNIIAKSYQLMVGRHQLMPVGYRRKASAYSDFPYGGGQPLQGRVPARGDKPPYCRHHFRRQHGLFRARQKIPGRYGSA